MNASTAAQSDGLLTLSFYTAVTAAFSKCGVTKEDEYASDCGKVTSPL